MTTTLRLLAIGSLILVAIVAAVACGEIVCHAGTHPCADRLASFAQPASPQYQPLLATQPPSWAGLRTIRPAVAASRLAASTADSPVSGRLRI